MQALSNKSFNRSSEASSTAGLLHRRVMFSGRNVHIDSMPVGRIMNCMEGGLEQVFPAARIRLSQHQHTQHQHPAIPAGILFLCRLQAENDVR